MIQGSDVSDVPRPRGRALEAPSTIVSLQEQRGSAAAAAAGPGHSSLRDLWHAGNPKSGLREGSVLVV